MNVEISNYDVVVTECGWQIEVGIRQEEICGRWPVKQGYVESLRVWWVNGAGECFRVKYVKVSSWGYF